MDTISLEHRLWIDSPRARIWQALTDPDQLLKWLTPSLISMGAQMQRDEHGRIRIVIGADSLDFAVVEGVEETRQLTMRSLPDRLITTTFTLNEENDGTLVRVKVAGFELLLESAQQDRLNLCRTGWEQVLKNLEAFVNDAELPFAQVLVSPLFGYWRETKTTLSSERSIWIDSPRERVWRAITDPVELQKWFSPTTPWVLTALEVGGRFFVRDEETGAEMYTQVIELLDPPNRLVTRTVPEPPDTIVSGTTYTLSEEDGGTRLTVTLSGYEQQPEESRWDNMEQNTLGFGLMLLNVKAHVEGQDLPHPVGF